MWVVFRLYLHVLSASRFWISHDISILAACRQMISFHDTWPKAFEPNPVLTWLWSRSKDRWHLAPVLTWCPTQNKHLEHAPSSNINHIPVKVKKKNWTISEKGNYGKLMPLTPAFNACLTWPQRCHIAYSCSKSTMLVFFAECTQLPMLTTQFTPIPNVGISSTTTLSEATTKLQAFSHIPKSLLIIQADH